MLLPGRGQAAASIPRGETESRGENANRRAVGRTGESSRRPSGQSLIRLYEMAEKDPAFSGCRPNGPNARAYYFHYEQGLQSFTPPTLSARFNPL